MNSVNKHNKINNMLMKMIAEISFIELLGYLKFTVCTDSYKEKISP